MPHRLDLKGRTAVVTGAASGIGRALAVILAERGCHLALADIDEPGMAETVRRLEARVRVSVHTLDVADPVQVAGFPEVVSGEHPGVDLLVNNAGVAIGGSFEEVLLADFEWLFSINFWGTVRMTRAFLPLLRRSDDARLVNLSSIYGMIAPPGQAAYVASKFAVRGFSESLRHELEATTVGVTVVHPGGVATAIVRNARPRPGDTPDEVQRQRRSIEARLRLPPAVAAKRIIDAVQRRRPRVLVGLDARIAATAERIAPVRHWSLLGRSLR